MKTAWLQRPQLNPILVKELRSRMRGVRPYAILTFFLLALTMVGFALYQIVASQARFGMTVLSAQVGQMLFAGLALCEIALVAFLSPAVSAGSISGEREQLTYDMLLATPLRPAAILWGKLLAALSYVFLLIFAAVPLFSVVLLFGGVAPHDMLNAVVLLYVTALTFGTVGLCCSALMRRTAGATILAYALLLLIIGGSLFAPLLWSSMYGQQAPPWLQYLNPIAALASIVFSTPQGMFGMPIGMPMMEMSSVPYGMGGMSIFGLLAGSVTYYGPNGPVVVPIYRATLVLYPLITLLLCWLTSHLVRLRARWLPTWGDLLFAAFFAAGMVAAYLARAWWLVPAPTP
jgi:ABC-2 type transport system permease protein